MNEQKDLDNNKSIDDLTTDNILAHDYFQQYKDSDNNITAISSVLINDNFKCNFRGNYNDVLELIANTLLCLSIDITKILNSSNNIDCSTNVVTTHKVTMKVLQDMSTILIDSYKHNNIDIIQQDITSNISINDDCSSFDYFLSQFDKK